MKVRFIGAGSGENAECTVFGMTFVRDEWVTLPEDVDPIVPRKLAHNPTFEVWGDHDDDGKTGGSRKRRKVEEPAEPAEERPAEAAEGEGA